MTVQDLKMLTAQREYRIMMEQYNTTVGDPSLLATLTSPRSSRSMSLSLSDTSSSADGSPISSPVILCTTSASFKCSTSDDPLPVMRWTSGNSTFGNACRRLALDRMTLPRDAGYRRIGNDPAHGVYTPSLLSHASYSYNTHPYT
ncbi:hypothetical protein DYB28_013743 [Aphanomyces astaci]|uniref:Uncharacterized protein n=1 Tax=Aphanomyces astaci TaxID=112090 RepID=A0A9X8DJ52_APHAT|nr:hypothetical protein DYB28_013743 [Aphanomyces astaci]